MRERGINSWRTQVGVCDVSSTVGELNLVCVKVASTVDKFKLACVNVCLERGIFVCMFAANSVRVSLFHRVLSRKERTLRGKVIHLYLFSVLRA